MPTPFAFYDPDSSSWRTSALSLLEEWGEFSETWPRSGMTRGGSAYERPTPALPTDVSGPSSSLLLPTPEAKLSDSGPDYARASRPGSGGDDLVTTLAKMLPTPQAADGNGGGRLGSEGHAMPLPGAIAQLLPTPTSRDHKGPNQRGDDTCLHGALLPTPKATDGTKGGPNQRGSSGDLTLPSAVQPDRLLPTPMTANRTSRKAQTGRPTAGPSRGGPSYGLEDIVETRLLPTPQAADSERGSMTMYRGEGNPTLLGAVQPDKLLPTPSAHDSGNTPENHLRKKPGRTQVMSLQVIVDHGLIETGGKLLPTPTAGDAKASRNSTVPRAPESTANIGDTLTDAVTVLRGDRTRARSADGSTPSDGTPHAQLSLDPEEEND